MTLPDKYPIVLSVREFREEYGISGGVGVYHYDNGSYGWQAEADDGSALRGPISKGVLDRADGDELAMVKYHWDKEGQLLEKPIWVLQKRPTQYQVEKTYSLFALLELLNEKKKVLWGEKWKPFKLDELKYQLENCKKDESYVNFSIPKKNGKPRNISAPNHGLKAIQACLNLVLQEKYCPTSAAMGFVPGRSVVSNASVHQRQKYVYNIDIKDFFPSISEGRVFSVLQQKPYSFDKMTAGIIADLCCHKGVLPQGAPTSPILTNIICERLDWRLSKLANQYHLKYSRYADDISFSGMENLFHEDGDFVNRLHHYIAKEGFVVNPDKTRLNTRGFRQEVTGLSVNEKPNVSKRYVKSLRTMIHNWEVIGREEAQSRMASEYKKSGKIHVKGIPQIENVIQGKLNYLKMVKGGGDPTYLKLNERYAQLFNQAYGLRTVLVIWNKKGFAAAAKEYIKRFPWEQEYDTGVWTLSEFEDAIGKKVSFVSRNTEGEVREDMTRDETQLAQDEKGSTLARVLLKMGLKEEVTPIIDGQPYFGKTRLFSDRHLNLNEDVFVSYGEYKGVHCFYFSNYKGHLIGGSLYDDEQIDNIVSGFKSGQYPPKTLEMIMKHKCVSPEERNMRTKLVVREFDSVVENLNNEIDSLRDEIGRLRGTSEEGKDHNLYGVSDFLYKFNKDKVLRYTGHLWDKLDDVEELLGSEQYNYEKHLDLIINRWEEFSKPYLNDKPTKNIRGLINAYIRGDKPWSTENITTSWNSPEVKNWAKEHPGIVLTPDKSIIKKQKSVGYELPQPFSSRFDGQRVSTFGELVGHFKKFFHIKGGAMLKRILEYQKWNDVEIKFSSRFELHNELFTDVDKLIDACGLIVQMAKDASEQTKLGKPIITFSFYEVDNGLLILSVLHENSVYAKGFSNMGRLGKSQTKLKGLMCGVCSIIIQADCGEGRYGEYNLLDENEPTVKEISEVKGVNYLLRFKQNIAK